MPLYEFECETCGHKFEVLQKVVDPNPTCPAPAESGEAKSCAPCGHPTRKLISGSTFSLKGSGWASDGYS